MYTPEFCSYSEAISEQFFLFCSLMPIPASWHYRYLVNLKMYPISWAWKVWLYYFLSQYSWEGSNNNASFHLIPKFFLTGRKAICSWINGNLCRHLQNQFHSAKSVWYRIYEWYIKFFSLWLVTFSMVPNSCLLRDIQCYKLDAFKHSAQMAWRASPSWKGSPSLTVVPLGKATPPTLDKVTWCCIVLGDIKGKAQKE